MRHLRYQHFEMDAFMPPFIAMANLCGLDLQPVIKSFGIMVYDPNDTEHNNAVIAEARRHRGRLSEAVKSL